MTTPQIYGIFAALSCAAIAGFIFYCIGLRAGRDAGEKQAKEQARAACEELLQHRIAEAEDLRSQLDARTREAMTLRNNIKAEAEDHAKVERGLLNRLAAAAPLSDEDHAVMLAVGAKLELAAGTFAGLGSHDHARFSRHLMAQVLDMAERIKKAQVNAPHPDSELIDFLATIANLKVGDGEWCIELPVMFQPHRNASMREIIRHYQTELEKLENEYEETQESARDMEDAA